MLKALEGKSFDTNSIYTNDDAKKKKENKLFNKNVYIFSI